MVLPDAESQGDIQVDWLDKFNEFTVVFGFMFKAPDLAISENHEIDTVRLSRKVITRRLLSTEHIDSTTIVETCH